MNLKKFKHELRLNGYRHEKWGTAMGCFFEVASLLYAKQGHCPSHWGYRPGAAGNYIDKEGSFYRFLCRYGAKNLTIMGEYLHRLTTMLDKAGKSY